MADENGKQRMGLPDRRANTYAALETKLDDHMGAIENRFSKWLKRGLIAFSIIAISCIAALVGFGIVIQQIQKQRYENCTSQNTRHDNALIELNKAETQAIIKHPEFAIQIHENHISNARLINAIAPRNPCAKIQRFALTPW